MIAGKKEKFGPRAEALITKIRERARNLYQTRQLMCAEAVLVALNHGLDGGLSEAKAVAMAAPFCDAIGKSGCLCGALSGGLMAVGLFGGNDKPYRHRREIRAAARQLHDTFKDAHGAACCRTLSRKDGDDKTVHFMRCADRTAEATEMAARLILKKRPDLVTKANNEFLAARQSMTGGLFFRLFRYLF